MLVDAKRNCKEEWNRISFMLINSINEPSQYNILTYITVITVIQNKSCITVAKHKNSFVLNIIWSADFFFAQRFVE